MQMTTREVPTWHVAVRNPDEQGPVVANHQARGITLVKIANPFSAIARHGLVRLAPRATLARQRARPLHLN